MNEYGDTSAYHPRKLTDKLLAKYRTGLSAGNPGEMVLLVREIDRLRKKRPWSDLEPWDES